MKGKGQSSRAHSKNVYSKHFESKFSQMAGNWFVKIFSLEKPTIMVLQIDYHTHARMHTHTHTNIDNTLAKQILGDLHITVYRISSILNWQ